MLNQVSGKSVLDIVSFSIILIADMLLPWIKPFTGLFNWESCQPGFGVLQVIIAVYCVIQIVWSWNNYKELG